MKRPPPGSGENVPPPATINLRKEVKAPERTARASTLPLPDPDVCDRLLGALERAALDSAHSMEALRIAVSEFTIALKDQGNTPEALLISLKSLINGRVVIPRRDPFVSLRKPEIHEKISSWAIQEYFKGNEGA